MVLPWRRSVERNVEFRTRPLSGASGVGVAQQETRNGYRTGVALHQWGPAC